MSNSKWSGEFWADYGERLLANILYQLSNLLVVWKTDIDLADTWPLLGLPIALAAIKGISANLVSPDSGASLLPSPPAPEVNEDGPGE